MTKKLIKLAQTIENKYSEKSQPDPTVVVHEHENVKPVSYMAFSNLKNIIMDASELLSLMNEEDDLPQWCDEMIALAKAKVSKALAYVRSEKSK